MENEHLPCFLSLEDLEICLQLLHHPAININIADAEKIANLKKKLQIILGNEREKNDGL